MNGLYLVTIGIIKQLRVEAKDEAEARQLAAERSEEADFVALSVEDVEEITSDFTGAGNETIH